MFQSNIITCVLGFPSNIPVGYKWNVIGFGECSSDWIPDTFTKVTSYDGIEWMIGDTLIVCEEGTYTEAVLV